MSLFMLYTNTHVIVYVIHQYPCQCLWCCHHDLQSLREFTWWMHCRTVPDGCWRWPSRPIWAISLRVGGWKLHPLLPFIITRPESCYSFHHPTEGRRLSRRRWLVTYPDGCLLQAVTHPKYWLTMLISRHTCFTCIAVAIINNELWQFQNATECLQCPAWAAHWVGQNPSTVFCHL